MPQRRIEVKRVDYDPNKIYVVIDKIDDEEFLLTRIIRRIEDDEKNLDGWCKYNEKAVWTYLWWSAESVMQGANQLGFYTVEAAILYAMHVNADNTAIDNTVDKYHVYVFDTIHDYYRWSLKRKELSDL